MNEIIQIRNTAYVTKVLLVDDQAIVAESVGLILKPEADIEYYTCDDATQALKYANEIKPTVILQDLIMPGIGGLDLLNYYRANLMTRNIPIIMLSIEDESSIKAKCFEYGANDYIVKLPHKSELIARIKYHSNNYILHLQKNDAQQQLHDNQQKLVKSNLELEQKNQALEKFAHMVAHDLKNPISNIKGFTEMLREESSTEEQNTLLNYIIESTSVMHTIIDEMLQFSHQGIEDNHFEYCSITSIIDNAKKQLHWQINERHASIIEKLTHDEIWGNKELLTQAFVNILNNAIKYTALEKQPLIHIQAKQVYDKIAISIQDNGIGICKKNHDKIFKHLERTQSIAVEGFGIGLSTVKKIIDTHGGEINLQSEFGIGSTFTLILKKKNVANHPH